MVFSFGFFLSIYWIVIIVVIVHTSVQSVPGRPDGFHKSRSSLAVVVIFFFGSGFKIKIQLSRYKAPSIVILKTYC